MKPESGEARTVSITPLFQRMFGKVGRDQTFDNVDFAGMLPRTAIYMINADSPARGKLMPSDAIVEVRYPNGDAQRNPTAKKLMEWLNNAGQTNQALTFVVERDGKEVTVENIIPSVKLDEGRRGLSIQLRPDGTRPVIADVLENSPARTAGIPANSQITAIDGKPVASWFEVKSLLAAAAKADEPVKLTLAVEGGTRDVELKLSEKQVAQVAGLAYTSALTYSIPFLHERVEPRQTANAATAAAWGVTETRDFVLQFYLTLKRMVQGSVSYKNMMGPVGIFDAGRKFAYKGNDWLIWFLAMISANLAVVNFLPIPIVDGGLFTFLVIEKIQGRPLSAKTQSIAQVVGLAVLLSVFLLVTYQDIARFL